MTQELFSDFDTLLQAVHAHVHREGVGKCRVTLGDDPFRLLLGYKVEETDGAEPRCQIRLSAFKGSSAAAWSRLGAKDERKKVAEILELGELPTPD